MALLVDIYFNHCVLPTSLPACIGTVHQPARELARALGQAVQGTQPVEAPNDDEAARETMAGKAAASQEAAGPGLL